MALCIGVGYLVVGYVGFAIFLLIDPTRELVHRFGETLQRRSREKNSSAETAMLYPSLGCRERGSNFSLTSAARPSFSTIQ